MDCAGKRSDTPNHQIRFFFPLSDLFYSKANLLTFLYNEGYSVLGCNVKKGVTSIALLSTSVGLPDSLKQSQLSNGFDLFSVSLPKQTLEWLNPRQAFFVVKTQIFGETKPIFG